ncbi:protein of unknown function [Taphrina deformans PYCC 5710]|uniref:Ubiquitin carboxyl-terminal hydrolase n=1 Tax=Taphrina deformans (strain PYCC 5710 / ATCC 11124 / CBS 356.35 / IMI 108563 / JCM 9778 / NBRC 8474) TaxID=1097556 RepID=R4XMR8_TAPDE|nr:protein of unknown function [Taphrina deformans PYCC 5710]|eukprot:CCG84597.1 protein of unknown function [Taphrina deformans PYCC 5710]
MAAIRWRPIENNPEVLTELSHSLGLDASFGFHDVYSLDDTDLLAFVPRPALALVLVFPVSESYENFRHRDDASVEQSNGVDEKAVVWLKQTIGNACGTMAILHTVSNNESKLTPDSDFANLLKEIKQQETPDRVRTIERSKLIDSAHQAAAGQGQSAIIEADEPVDLHFVAFVKSETNQHLYELDGRRKGPIDHGLLGEDEDMLSEKALNVVKQFVSKAGDGGDLNFSLCALAPN